MRSRLLSLTFAFAGLIVFSQPVSAANFCITPEVSWAAARAEVIFSGKITHVERVETAAAGDYFVTFEVETWWKGTPSPEMCVLWRSSVEHCPLLPVGEVGENYLVYADPSKGTRRDLFPEVTFFNRTSRLPANRKPGIFLRNDWRKTGISPEPELNRADASGDIALLRTLRACGCLSTSHLPPPFHPLTLTLIQPDSEAETAFSCKSCLRSRLKPF